MLSEIISGIVNAIRIVFNISMLTLLVGRALPPIIVDTAIISWSALLISRLRKAKIPEGKNVFGNTRAIAHRGALLDAPENSFAALKYCVENGCKHIEFDVRISKDGKCLLHHDVSVDGHKINETDWENLKCVEVSPNHINKSRFGVQYLCLYDDAIEYLVSNNVKMVIDVKGHDTRLFSAIIDSFKRHPWMFDNTIVTSFNPLTLYKIRKLEPKIIGALSYRPHIFSALSYSSSERSKLRFSESKIKHYISRMLDELHAFVWWTGILAYWTGCSALFIHKDIISISMAKRWSEKGYAVAVFSVNQPSEKHQMMKTFCLPYLTDTLIGEPR